MKKNDKKRKLKYAISTVFFLIVTILDVFDLYNDIFNGHHQRFNLVSHFDFGYLR